MTNCLRNAILLGTPGMAMTEETDLPSLTGDDNPRQAMSKFGRPVPQNNLRKVSFLLERTGTFTDSPGSRTHGDRVGERAALFGS